MDEASERSSRCFHGHNLHPQITASVHAFTLFSFRTIVVHENYVAIKTNIGHHFRLEENEHLFRCLALAML